MEFLKNHYEKILLSLVLIGLAGAAGMLAIQALETRSQMSELVALEPNKRAGIRSDPVGSLRQSLTNAKAPQRVDFDGAHKIFNPEKVLRNRLTGEMIPNGEIGPKNLVIQQIRPLRLVVRAESKTIVGRKRLYLHYLAEYEPGTMGMRWNKRTISKVGSKIYLVGPISKQRQMIFTVTDIGDPATDDVLVDLELTIGTGLPIPIQLRGTNAWEQEMEYAVDLHYPPEDRGFQNVRQGYPLMPPFGGDTNYVIQITENAVTLRSLSNQKRITLRWKTEEPQIPPQAMPAAATNSVSTNAVPAGPVGMSKDGDMTLGDGAGAGKSGENGSDSAPPGAPGATAPTADKKPAPTP